MTWSNYDDVITQMRGLGLIVDGLDVGRMRRCKVEDDRERRGWYMLHELRLDDGDTVLVGSYGIWRGTDNNAQKVELGKLRKLTDDQKAALKARMAADKKRVDAERNRTAALAARRARQVWDKLAPAGECQYLESKNVKAYGLKFSDSGCAYLPLLDAQGSIHGLQILLPKGHKRIEQTGRNKDFWPAGLIKKGHWFQIGAMRDIVLIAEGYATAASIHEATGLPVAVAFDAGNLLPVAEAIKKRHRAANVLICADDDFKSEGNPGMSAASAAALAIGGQVISPVFSIDREAGKKGLTDFNDLHLGEGLHTVRAQIEARLDALEWRVEAKPRAGGATQGGGENSALKPLITIDEAAGRFSLIYGMGGKSLFDFQEFRVVHKDEMLNITPGRAWEDIKWHPDWRAYRDSEVGFDPDGSNPEIKCNLYSGWPTVPKNGRCAAILDLLEYLCSHETKHANLLLDWIIKWLAYPVQHPGAKMQTALIVHGEQGAGKNTFFSKALRPIYGKYGVEFGQTAMEEKFNGWMSGILFGIGNEVIASREELYHVKGKIKNMITEPSWQIRSMHQDARMERNCCNFVFFSNDLNALHLDPKDRRFCVVWTPPTPQPRDPALDDFRKMIAEVNDELDNGGAAALHDYLLHVELGDFGVATPPPLTQAKEDLIELNLDSKERFYQEWTNGNLGDIPCGPVTTALVYEFYREWCGKTGIRNAAPQHTLLATIYKKPGVKHEQTMFLMPDATKATRGTVIYVSGVTDPVPGKNKSSWLGEEIDAFNKALNCWKEDKSC